ncbi:MAG: CopD family protein [Methylophilaceae bacterium]|nr:CopD family protein [Methylophilaceae bacterium]MDG1445924.1 CopD family protein [Methylophilaceae bacterium]MDG1821581.1 CopD family protein [Methylophilaceae bacterium]MDG2293488.1 CopD family protein [Methylophilaceae bacterium]
MLWIKSLHIIFVTSWFAGLFYLPRIFVNHAMETNTVAIERLSFMETKLYRFMLPLAFLALGFGLWLWLGYGISGKWMHPKLTLVVGLIGYHWYCGKIIRDFKAGTNQRSHIWFRWFNELPVLALSAIVVLVVVKPF